ncbi:hypothetical protein CesoFtcFv8_000246 [Champsocephalus esox]|uniref:Uncharacterized protein n=1 Tax=Champsocephalus esox TaxID=159716 RepID=A0AAN8E208_9TELE|nr:hypothetical protein CesoFtcFv8_000246 [Champsocephalus esox]
MQTLTRKTPENQELPGTEHDPDTGSARPPTTAGRTGSSRPARTPQSGTLPAPPPSPVTQITSTPRRARPQPSRTCVPVITPPPQLLVCEMPP